MVTEVDFCWKFTKDWLYLAKNGNKTGEMDGDTFITMLSDITAFGKMTEPEHVLAVSWLEMGWWMTNASSLVN